MRTQDGKTSLMYAACDDNDDMVTLLATNNANLEDIDDVVK